MIDADANFLDDAFTAPGMLEVSLKLVRTAFVRGPLTVALTIVLLVAQELLKTARAVGVEKFVTPVCTLQDCEAGLKV